MFDDYFVRVTCNLLIKEKDFLTNNNFNPELYITGFCLNKICNGSYGEIKTLIKNFSKHTIHAPFFDISPGGFDEDIRKLSFEKLDTLLDIAHDWGTELVVVHFNYDDIYYHENFAIWLENSIDFFRRLVKKERKPLIALENIAEKNPRIVLKLMQGIKSKKFIHCFDVGHHHVFGEISAGRWLEELAPLDYIHFHFHDNFGDYDNHLPIGSGNIEWEQMKEIIKNLHCDFSVTLEPHSKTSLIKTVNNYKILFLNNK